ncbi:MAG: HdeD family acid-resistance protein, partial [Micromonosporaceae bacterium]
MITQSADPAPGRLTSPTVRETGERPVDNNRLLTWLLVARGVLAIIFGVIAVAWPRVTVLALALLFGVFALVNGVGLLIGAFRRGRDVGQRIGYTLAGLLGVATAVITVVWPGITAPVLAI